MDPLSFITAGVNTSIRLFEVTYQLKAVDEQAADLLSTTKHVDRNLNEARRLRRLKAKLLTTGESTWMDGIIDDTDRALRGVANLVEPARVDQSTKNSINFGHRVMWVFRDNPQVRDKHQRLSMCHQSLTAVISCLYSKDMVVLAPAPENKTEQPQQQPPPYDPEMPSLFEWRRERSRNRSTSNIGNNALGSPDSFKSDQSTIATITPASSAFPSPELRGPEAVYPSITTIGSSRARSDGDLLKADSASPGRSNEYNPESYHTIPPSSHERISPTLNTSELQGFYQKSTTRPVDQAPVLPDFDFYDHASSFSADTTPLQPTFQTSNVQFGNTPPRPPKVPLEHNTSPSVAVDITKTGQIGPPSIGIEAVPYSDPGGLERAKSLDSGGQGTMRKGGRGWLAYHAIRSDMGHQSPT